MRQVEYFRWWITAPGRKKAYLTSFHMDAETAQQRHPAARPEPSTRVLREVPETPAEEAAALARYQSAGHDGVKPPPS